MSKGNTFENDLLKLIFNGSAIADIAENDGSSPLTNLYFALHTADPGEAGAQNTTEADYGSYARVAVPRDNTGFTITNNSVSPAANVDFPESAGAGTTLTHWSVGTASSGAGKILYKGALSASIAVVAGTIPRIKTTSTITED